MARACSNAKTFIPVELQRGQSARVKWKLKREASAHPAKASLGSPAPRKTMCWRWRFFSLLGVGMGYAALGREDPASSRERVMMMTMRCVEEDIRVRVGLDWAEQDDQGGS